MDDWPLHYVRLLTCIADSDDIWPGGYITSSTCSNDVSGIFRDYYLPLHQLRHFTLYSLCLPSAISWEVETFSAHTLSRLTLDGCEVTVREFVTIIDYFPNLNCLHTRYLFHKVDGKPPSPLSRPLLGQLRIHELSKEEFVLLGQLSELGLAFEEIIVGVGAKRPRLFGTFRGCTCIIPQTGPAVRLTKSTPCSYRQTRRRSHSTLSLPRAPRIRVFYDGPGGRSHV